MKINKKSVYRLFAALVSVLMLTLLAAPLAFAADPDKPTITIKNAEGLPGMVEGQFSAFQLFKGTAHSEGDAGDNDWGATSWNNYTLADIEWGENLAMDDDVPKLLTALKALDSGWVMDGGESNVFADVTDAESFARVLVDKSNYFLQSFSSFVMTENEDPATKGDAPYLYLTGKPVTSTAYDNGTKDVSVDDYSKITVGSAGYYLIAETDNTEKVKSEYILAVLGNQTINIKADLPDVDKNIVTGDVDKPLVKGDTVGVTDVVTFRLSGTLPKNFMDYLTYEYIFNDTLSEGLTYANRVEVVVTIGADKYLIPPVTDAATATGYFFANTGKDVADSAKPGYGAYHKLTFKFADLMQLTGKKWEGTDWATDETPIPWNTEEASFDSDNVEITVTYTAKVNNKAVIGSAGNPNDVTLTYSNDPNSDSSGITTERKVKVYSFVLDLKKVGNDKDHLNGLSGAKFVLSKEVLQEGGSTKILYATFEDDKSTTEDTTDLILSGWVEDLSKATEFESSAPDGKFPKLNGLDEGTYTLTETKTPDGYNTIDPVEFTITATLTAPSEDQPLDLTGLKASLKEGDNRNDVAFDPSSVPEGKVGATLVNVKAPFLPFTGGIGTVIFYTVGGLMIAGAAIFLVMMTVRSGKKSH